MSRRANAGLRCERCHLHRSLCLCSLIPRIETRTRVVLVIHLREDRKPTNTGRLATECLRNSEVLVRGHMNQPERQIEWGARQPLLLFPHEDAMPIDTYMAQRTADRDVTLIVPDGNWRQASKVRKRVPGMEQVPCVTLPPAQASRYRLRSEAHATGMATMEAIARALRVLEGDRGTEVEHALEHVLRVLVERTLWCRGAMETHEVYGGIPEGAERHLPVGNAVGAGTATLERLD
jgi:DTW domain-containing protein